MITIFTPTYNRAYRLPNLYESLKRQTCKDFEWLVVDDGSADNTSDLFNEWQQENDFPIRYQYQENGGKHRAINQGLKLAKGHLFFIVDSDDSLPENAIATIKRYEDKCTNKIGGLCFRKYDIRRQYKGPSFPLNEFESNSIELSTKYNISGDKAEIFRTDILQQYPFPEYNGETFVPEALIWYRIAEKYQLYCIDAVVYNFEYLEDGLTRNFHSQLKKNPQGFSLFYNETAKRKVFSIRQRLICWLRYYQCLFYRNWL